MTKYKPCLPLSVQYICDAIDCLSFDEKSKRQPVIVAFCIGYNESFNGHYHLNSDTTLINKAHSRVLSERPCIRVSNNVIKTNKPLGIGYRLSTLTLSGKQNWQLPLSMELVGNDQTATERLSLQLASIFLILNYPYKVQNQ